MAHATDYASRDHHTYINLTKRSKLTLSPSSMNPSPQIQPHNSPYLPNSHHHHAYTLVLNFLRDNSNWSIDSIFTYCLKQYSDFDVTPAIISRAISTFIDEKYQNEPN
tara:strand:+ start:377 stop:700 length:324 start_codon:yes stop_codon:yes gene_type:complete